MGLILCFVGVPAPLHIANNGLAAFVELYTF